MELEQPPGRGTPDPLGEAGEPPVADPAVVDRPVARPLPPRPDGERPAGPRSEQSADLTSEPPAKPKKARRGPGRNLPIAIGVGVALGAMVLLSVYLVQWVFIAIMAIFLGIAARELSVAMATRGIRVALLPVLLGGLAMLVLSYTAGPVGLMAASGPTVLLILVWRMPGGARDYLRDTTAGIFTAVYIPFLGGFAALMLASDDGPDRIITFIAITVASDIGGFFVGAFLGRHKLAPSISPKKTWEGLAGSAITCMGIGALLLPLLLDGHIWQGVVVGAAVVCSATLGDLIESMIKRDLGIKDMGRLLPEHGGVLDRLDSLLATAPVVWLALQIFVPPT